MRTRIDPELTRRRLAERRVRLARLLELNAPDLIVEKEKRLISRAICELETGYEEESREG